MVCVLFVWVVIMHCVSVCCSVCFVCVYCFGVISVYNYFCVLCVSGVYALSLCVYVC